MLKLTKDQLTAFKPCGLEDRLAMFGRRKTMNAKQAVAAEVPIHHLCWVLDKLCEADDAQAIAVRNEMAEWAAREVVAYKQLEEHPVVKPALAALSEPNTEGWRDLLDPLHGAGACVLADALRIKHAGADGYVEWAIGHYIDEAGPDSLALKVARNKAATKKLVALAMRES